MLPTTRSWKVILSMSIALAAGGGGCIELQNLLLGLTPTNNDGENGSNNNGNDNSPPDSTSGPPLRVSLTVSNPTPQLNEQVRLVCAVVEGEPTGALFDFQPSSPRLLENTTAGTASLIIEMSDLGSSFSFTCTATTPAGTSDPSPTQIIIPTS